MSLTGSRRLASSFFSSSCRSATAMPRSVTTTSTVSPGVVMVVTSSRMIGSRPRIDGATTMASLAPAAVSQCPPVLCRR